MSTTETMPTPTLTGSSRAKSAAFAGASTFGLANVALGGLVVSEVARRATELAAYRRVG